MAHLANGILLSTKKEPITGQWKDREEPQMHGHKKKKRRLCEKAALDASNCSRPFLSVDLMLIQQIEKTGRKSHLF